MPSENSVRHRKVSIYIRITNRKNVDKSRNVMKTQRLHHFIGSVFKSQVTSQYHQAVATHTIHT